MGGIFRAKIPRHLSLGREFILCNYVTESSSYSLSGVTHTGNKGRFPLNKNFGSKFLKFHVPNGMVHSGCTILLF